MKFKHWRLKSKKAIITGATRGIGRAVADEFLNLGAEILVISRTRKELEEYVEQKQQQGYKDQVDFFVCDVSKENSRRKLSGEINKNWGAVDILVNNAGMNFRKGYDEYNTQDYDEIVKTNIRSAFHLSQIISPFMKQRENPSIVNVSSVAGMTAVKTGVVYAISKAAMNQLTKNLAVEMAEENIRVNAVAPWYTNTPMVKNLLADQEYKNKVLERTPLKRIAEPEEVANMIAFLCMPAASFVTGQIIAVDGGFMAYGF
jgi:Tropinone reductase 1